MFVPQLIQIGYWLALSAWFGCVLFVVIAQQVIFKTVRESNPILPHVLAVNLEGQHSTLLAGTIMGNLLAMLVRVEIVCAAMLLIAMGAQWYHLNLHDAWTLSAECIRTALYLGATIIVVYDWRVLWPRIWKYRQEFIDNADEPDKANPARDQFNHYQQESMMLLSILLFLLLGIVLFSGGMDYAVTHIMAGAGAAQ